MPLVGGGLVGCYAASAPFLFSPWLQSQVLDIAEKRKSSQDNRREFCQWSDTPARLMTRLSFVTSDLSRVRELLIARRSLQYYLYKVVASSFSDV